MNHYTLNRVNLGYMTFAHKYYKILHKYYVAYSSVFFLGGGSTLLTKDGLLCLGVARKPLIQT